MIRDVFGSDRVARFDPVENPVRVRGIEVGVKEGSLGIRDYYWRVGGCGGGVVEFGTHFGNGVEGEREGVEDDGDKGGGAAEGFGDDEAITVEDVMAVVADDEATAGNGVGISDHERGS